MRKMRGQTTLKCQFYIYLSQDEEIAMPLYEEPLYNKENNR